MCYREDGRWFELYQVSESVSAILSLLHYVMNVILGERGRSERSPP